jgi:futalosine hydrolase
MPIKILCVIATQPEAEILKNICGKEVKPGIYRYQNIELTTLCTGVGSIATAWSLKQWLSTNEKPDLAVNIGIAGSYRDDLEVGQVVIPVSDCFADAGIEDNNQFLTLSEAGLSDADHFPFESGAIYCRNSYVDGAPGSMKKVKAITVNTATGSEITIKKLINKFNPDIETMEGATFFYICTRENLPFLAIRAISNRVEARNRSNWDIPVALKNLSEGIEAFFLKLD